MYMLDTNICIYAMKNRPEGVLQHLQDHIGSLCISSITLAELWHGIQKSVFPEKSQRAFLKFSLILDILPFDDLAAIEYGKICAALQKQGTPIGTMDMLIAAHAKASDCTLVTNNMREFERVEGLRLVNWAD